MTPLDQAFAKAFSQREMARILPPRATRAVPLGEALGREVVRRVAAAAPVSDGQLEEALKHAPQPEVKPSGSVPAPHFFLRRQAPASTPEPQLEMEPEPEIAPEPLAVAEPTPDQTAAVEPEADSPAAEAEPKCEQAMAVVAEQPAPASVDPPIAAPAEFSPGLQVDHFVWPAVCSRLTTAAQAELDRIVLELKPQSQRRKVVAIAASSRGAGATSLLLCVAQRLAASGVRTVAVDGDLSQPQLGQMLGLAPECGWEEALAGREPLDEVLIDSVDDHMVVLPLEKCVGPSRDLPARAAQSLATLCEHYEAVLLNLGPPDDWWVLGDLVDRRLAEQIGLLVAVCDARHADDQLDRLCRKASAAGIDQVVLVENFVANH